MKKLLLGIVAMALGLSVALNAQAADYTLDEMHSTALFKISHLGFSNTFGMFEDISGTMTYDPENVSDNAIAVTVKTASVNTLVEARDNHLRNDDFLDVEKYPEMTFTSSAWEKVEDNHYKVTGDFTLMGTTKEIEVDVQVIGSGEGRSGEFRIGFETTFTIKRSEYGMDKMIPAVGDEVTITFGTEAIRNDE